MRRALLLFAALVTLPACYSDGADEAIEEAIDQVTDTASLTSLAGLWMQAYARGDADGLAEFFADDGVYAANDGQLLRGKEEIRAAARQWVTIPHEVVSFGVLRSGVAGALGYIVMSYAVRVEPRGSAGYLMEGYASAVFRRQADGGRKIESLVVNRQPLP